MCVADETEGRLKGAQSKCSVLRRLVLIIGVLIATSGRPQAAWPQPNDALEKYFRQYVGLSQDQIASIEAGHPVAKALPSRTPAEVFLFGAVYIHASPESYVKFSRDYDRLRKLPSNLALGTISNPPKLSDLNGFTFDSDDIKALKDCKPGDCQIQMPASSIDELQHSINWSAPDASVQVNQHLQKTALQSLQAYQHDGNGALGSYNDKSNPTDVQKQFAYMLSYDKALPAYLPDFYRYLLSYPKSKPANIEDSFYWARVKFGLKPTLRLVHVVSMRGNPGDQVAYAQAEKQLYSSHYFETALDLTFCVRDTRPNQSGFYLITVMGSEQAGLTDPKGAIVRKAAVGRSVSNLQSGLSSVKNEVEAR